ncbi:MAG: hypothetical protein AB7I38_18875 [Dehalococcoidia bacterium]
MTRWAEAYRRLLVKKRHLQGLYRTERATTARVTAERDQARSDAQLWRNLLWLAPYSGRNGIRGDRLQYQPRIPAQRRPTEPDRARAGGRQ